MPRPQLARVAAIVALVFLGAVATAQPWLVDDFRAVYSARVGIARGETELELRKLGDNLYEVESSTRLKGFMSLFKRGRIHEASRFEYRDGELRTLWFERRDDVSREDRNVRVDYDWEALTGTVQHGGRNEVVAIDASTSNTLVMQIALMQDIRSGRRLDRYHVLGHKGRLRFDVTYEDELRVDALDGNYAALRYSHERPGSGTRTTFWALRELGYLPARCEIVKDDKLRGRLKLDAFVSR